MDRRNFLKTGAAGLALSTLAPRVHAQGAAEKLRVGLIGAGWYGKNDVFRLIQVAPVEVVSVCDVDSRMLSEAAELISQRQASHRTPRTYGDYRKLLAEKDLDIVLIGTPDHWHALPMIAAVEAGADVYVQKPISVDIAEGKAMVDAARRTGRTVQVGTQRRSTPHLAEAKQRIVQSGLLGKVAYVEVFCYHGRTSGNPPDTAPPDYLDYEMWTGPAPMRPYNELVHPRSWRGFMEYGNGIVGDMCIHMYDMVRWLLDLGWPKSVTSTGGVFVQKAGKANTSDTQTATFAHDELDIVWTHRTWGTVPDPDWRWAAFIHGDKGTLKASVYHYEFIPAPSVGGERIRAEWVHQEDQYPEDKTEKDMEIHVAPATRAHLRNFLEARRDKSLPVADIEQGHTSTAACILANMSMKLGGRTLTWDPRKQEIVGDEEANRLMSRPYRAPWVHPGTISS